MISPAQMMDRGRLLIGVLLVAPLGTVIAPSVADRAEHRAGGQWSLVASAPNPITIEEPTPNDVLARLTDPSLTAAATARPKERGTEIGSESAAAPAEPDAASAPPEAALAAFLRQSQARNAQGTATPPPASSAPAGPVPYATPTIASYLPPPGATHLFPIAGGAKFSNDWGGPRPGGRSHKGIDLFAPTGTPVVAISDGELFRVGWNAVGGWRFWLRDAWGNEFYHAHLSAFAPSAREGAVVRAGTVLGFVGNTGDARTTPPHVHFEIHPSGGDAIPPFQYVSGWPRV